MVLNTLSVKPPVCQALVIQESWRSEVRGLVSSLWSELILAVFWLPAAVSPTLEAVILVAVNSGISSESFENQNNRISLPVGYPLLVSCSSFFPGFKLFFLLAERSGVSMLASCSQWHRPLGMSPGVSMLVGWSQWHKPSGMSPGLTCWPAALSGTDPQG